MCVSMLDQQMPSIVVPPIESDPTPMTHNTSNVIPNHYTLNGRSNGCLVVGNLIQVQVPHPKGMTWETATVTATRKHFFEYNVSGNNHQKPGRSYFKNLEPARSLTCGPGGEFKWDFVRMKDIDFHSSSSPSSSSSSSSSSSYHETSKERSDRIKREKDELIVRKKNQQNTEALIQQLKNSEVGDGAAAENSSSSSSSSQAPNNAMSAAAYFLNRSDGGDASLVDAEVAAGRVQNLGGDSSSYSSSSSSFIPDSFAEPSHNDLNFSLPSDKMGFQLFKTKDGMVVKKILENSIAEKIGIEVGDKFITINDVSIAQSMEGGAQVVSLLTTLTRPVSIVLRRQHSSSMRAEKVVEVVEKEVVVVAAVVVAVRFFDLFLFLPSLSYNSSKTSNWLFDTIEDGDEACAW